MSYLFTSESVSEGHPDKIADQISDAILDNFLAFDPHAKVACETLVTTGQVILSGEVKSKTYVDVQRVARDVIKKIGYTNSEYKFDYKSCGILSMIHEQSEDINRGVVKKNIEDQNIEDFAFSSQSPPKNNIEDGVIWSIHGPFMEHIWTTYDHGKYIGYQNTQI